jgi:hypothetical protein
VIEHLETKYIAITPPTALLVDHGLLLRLFLLEVQSPSGTTFSVAEI